MPTAAPLYGLIDEFKREYVTEYNFSSKLEKEEFDLETMGFDGDSEYDVIYYKNYLRS